jgi:3-hydroxyisobutyrate dehydrogenase-like beta-hydroxyacid dehydrogenase
MGFPMARNLVRAGWPVFGFDPSPERCERAAAEGIRLVDSVQQAAVAAEAALISMVRTLPQTEGVLFGDAGVTAARRDNLDVILMSTLDPGAVKRIADRGAPCGISVVDAPVSGGNRGADAGTLTIMVAGASATVERVRELFAPLGEHIVVVGDHPGQGQAAKLANQIMMAAAMAGAVEGLEFARSYGLDAESVIEAVSEGTGSSWVLRNWAWMRSLWEDYEADGALDAIHKDMRAIFDVSGANWAPLPLAALAFQRLLEFWGTHDAVRLVHQDPTDS